MRRIIAFFAILLVLSVSLLSFISCGEKIEEFKDSITEAAKYDYAIIDMLDGTKVQVELVGYAMIPVSSPVITGNGVEYIGYYYQIFGKDGVGYIVDSTNCVLVNEPDVAIEAGSKNSTTKYTCTEVIMRMPGNEMLTIAGDDIEVANTNPVVKEKNGKIYHPDSKNIVIKFAYTE